MTIIKFSGRDDYFAVNDKPRALSTSFRVSGRLGELARRFWNYQQACEDNSRINRAYRLGYRHGIEFARKSQEADARQCPHDYQSHEPSKQYKYCRKCESEINACGFLCAAPIPSGDGDGKHRNPS